MKTMFIPAIKKEKLDKTKILLDRLPDTIYIAYAIQYKKIAEEIKKHLSKQKKIAGFVQILGCSRLKSKFPILLISEARFHALNLIEQGNDVYIFDNNNLTKISDKEILEINKKRKARLSNFYSSDKIGILVSVKPGQYNMKEAEKVKKNLENKRAYLFLADNIYVQEFENFPIDMWVNTACSGLSSDYLKIIHYEDLRF